MCASVLATKQHCVIISADWFYRCPSPQYSHIVSHTIPQLRRRVGVSEDGAVVLLCVIRAGGKVSEIFSVLHNTQQHVRRDALDDGGWSECVYKWGFRDGRMPVRTDARATKRIIPHKHRYIFCVARIVLCRKRLGVTCSLEKGIAHGIYIERVTNSGGTS